MKSLHCKIIHCSSEAHLEVVGASTGGVVGVVATVVAGLVGGEFTTDVICWSRPPYAVDLEASAHIAIEREPMGGGTRRYPSGHEPPDGKTVVGLAMGGHAHDGSFP
jgi:hypothetical protein